MKNESVIENLLDLWEEQQKQDSPPTPEVFFQQHGTGLSAEQLVQLRQAIRDLGNMDLALSTNNEGRTPGSTDDLAGSWNSGQSVVVSARFRVTRLHARGGLGEVYVAGDEELGREVALKVIQTSRAGTATSRNRFIREARLTGRLQHPGIVSVYGSGTDEADVPFYVMRFVSGRTLHEAVEEHFEKVRARADSGDRRLAFQQLLRRFVGVCDTIAYAHSKGVLHRDLKPSNILVGEFGETLVVDWGLARVISGGNGHDLAANSPIPDEALTAAVTQEGAVLGTPAYMSPEQASGQVDELGPTSDVYGLGAVLYTILTGRPAFEGGNIGAILQGVREGKFASPRTIRPEIPKALEAVCLKAMATNQGNRYPSAADLGRDVERWLADEPVTAYREPLIDRSRRWARRNRSLVSAAVVLLVTGVVALSLGLWVVGMEQKRTAKALADAEENLDRALTAEAEAKTNLSHAEANLERALTAETEAKTNLGHAEANLKLARQAVDECFNVAKEHPRFQEPSLEDTKKLLLKKTLPFYREFRSQRPDDRALNREHLEALVRVAYIEGILGKSVGQALSMKSQHPDQNTLASGYHTLGVMESRRGNREAALKGYQQARDIRVKLVKTQPDVAGYQNDLATTHHSLGSLLADLKNYEVAQKEYQQARDIRVKLVKTQPDVAGYQNDLASTHNALGSLLSVLGKREEALKAYQEARDIQLTLVKAHSEVPEYQNGLARTHYTVAGLLAGLGKREEAVKEYQQARDIRVKLAKGNPEVLAQQKDLAWTHQHLGTLLSGLGKHKEGLKEYEQARDIRVKLARDHPDVPEYQTELARTTIARGLVLARMSRPRDGLVDLDDGISMLDKVQRIDPTSKQVPDSLLFGLSERAAILTQVGKPADAVADWDRVLQLAPAAQRTSFRVRRAVALARAGDYQRAASEADDLARGNLPGVELYTLARIHALDAAHASSDLSRPLPERHQRAEQSAGRVVALLMRAAAEGHFRNAVNIALMDKEDDLAFVRDREDYKRFRMGLNPMK